MDILTQIDKYVLYSADAMALKEQIEACKKNESYALAEGELSYNRENYSLEKKYNESVNYNRQRIKALESKLKDVQMLLKIAKDSVKSITENSSYNDIHFASEKLKLKVEQLTSYVDRLKENLKLAYTNGDKAYNMGDFKAEKEYNQEYNRYLSEINKLNPVIESYKDAVTYLNFKELSLNESEQGPSK